MNGPSPRPYILEQSVNAANERVLRDFLAAHRGSCRLWPGETRSDPQNLTVDVPM